MDSEANAGGDNSIEAEPSGVEPVESSTEEISAEPQSDIQTDSFNNGKSISPDHDKISKEEAKELQEARVLLKEKKDYGHYAEIMGMRVMENMPGVEKAWLATSKEDKDPDTKVDFWLEMTNKDIIGVQTTTKPQQLSKKEIGSFVDYRGERCTRVVTLMPGSKEMSEMYKKHEVNGSLPTKEDTLKLPKDVSDSMYTQFANQLFQKAPRQAHFLAEAIYKQKN